MLEKDLLSASSFYERRLQPYDEIFCNCASIVLHLSPKDKANQYSDRRYISWSIPVTLWNFYRVFFLFSFAILLIWASIVSWR